MWGPARFRQYMRRNKVAFQPGAQVKWADGYGIVLKVFTHYLERTINGATVTRPANKRNPAYLIAREDGDTLLMNHSDLVLG